MDDYTSTGNPGLIDNYKSWIKETDPDVLKALMQDYLEQCSFQVLNFTEHYFSPHGYTCLWLLGESHLAIHTFPEKGLCYIELSSCNSIKNEQFRQLLSVRFAGPPAEELS